MVGQRKVAEGLAVNQALPLGDLQADGAKHFAVRALGHLKFRDPLGQVFDRELHGLPQSRQLADVIQRGASHAIVRRTHAGEFKTLPRAFKTQSRRDAGIQAAGISGCEAAPRICARPRRRPWRR